MHISAKLVNIFSSLMQLEVFYSSYEEKFAKMKNPLNFHRNILSTMNRNMLLHPKIYFEIFNCEFKFFCGFKTSFWSSADKRF